jgi:septum formation protein
MSLRKVVLASGSPRRAELIKNALKGFKGVGLEIVLPIADETAEKSEAPENYCLRMAVKKSEDVFFRLFSDTNGVVVVGCDTVAALNGKIYGKPKSKTEAVENFKRFSGNTHEVITAVCFTYADTENDKKIKRIDFLEKTFVTFGAFNEEIVYNYVEKGMSAGKAGGYGLQDAELAPIIVSVLGDKDGVIGLPVKRVREILNKINTIP